MYLRRLLLFVVLVASVTATPALAQADRKDEVRLLIVELALEEGRRPIQAYVISSTDDSAENPDYKLLGFHWYTTARYWINPSNKYGFSQSAVVTVITASAETWDKETYATVFSYQGTTSRSAGRYDGYNVVAWGSYRAGVIAVTYIWYSGKRVLETDTRMNTYYQWSLSGEARKFDVQNIMTHEFGHWAGLADLYEDRDYWLTMYGYAGYGETYKRTLGLGDIKGLEAVYGA
ncbi:MAG: hypothetical protein QW057_01010 [Candidatus Bathyarchaeia archaeon]